MQLFYFYIFIIFIYFNPYTPCGVQLNRAWRFYITLLFQPMHPLWGATRAVYGSATGISIHAPSRGATYNIFSQMQHILYFNPCTLAGCNETILAYLRDKDISIHAPSRGATVKANRINASDLQNIKQFLQLTHPQLSHTTGLLALLCILSLYPRCEPPLETM